MFTIDDFSETARERFADQIYSTTTEPRIFSVNGSDTLTTFDVSSRIEYDIGTLSTIFGLRTPRLVTFTLRDQVWFGIRNNSIQRVKARHIDKMLEWVDGFPCPAVMVFYYSRMFMLNFNDPLAIAAAHLMLEGN